MSHVCDESCPPLCKHRMAGDGGVGRPKAHPSKVGRTPREQDYARLHQDCELCGAPTRHIHHLARRGLGGWNRNYSPLQALCPECHLKAHA